VKKVLLTGSSGQLGQLLLSRFAQQAQFTVCPFDKAGLDITNTQTVIALFANYKPDIVINCAAYTAVDQAELNNHLCYSINVTAVQLLAQLCQQYGCLFISFSSDYVFDGKKNTPYTEQDQTSPLNQYGISKQLAERAAEQAQRYITIRTSWLFSNIADNFVTTIWRKALSGELTQVVQDQHGGPTPARALAAAVVELVVQYSECGELPYGLYHFSGYPHCSWFDFARTIYQIAAPQHLNLLQGINSPFPGSLAQRPVWSGLDMSLFQQRFTYAAPDWRAELITYLKVGSLYKD
jgi:dTDP-4-dehydrorhamnose reductase